LRSLPQKESASASENAPAQDREAARQLALRISVSSTSVTAITPGAVCSITSTATVSTTGTAGAFTFRAAFFNGAGFGLALATVRFAALRGLPRLAEFPVRSLTRFCTFDPFLRLAMIAPASGWCSNASDQKTTGNVPANLSNELSPDFSLSGLAWALFFLGFAKLPDLLAGWPPLIVNDMARGVYLIGSKLAQCVRAVQIVDCAGNSTTLRQKDYISKKIEPEYKTLPWQQDVAAFLSETAEKLR
jgi:hypothetical protein